MRILIANDGLADAGGVNNYLRAITGGLASRGHELAILHRDATPDPTAAVLTGGLPHFTVAVEGIEPTLDRVSRWAPDVCFSHNMNVLEVDRALSARWPLVKFMHGYFGTCIGGQKRFGFPVIQPCDRRFGIACLALYGPRHCGELKPGVFLRDYRWANEQHGLFSRYRAIVVASEHMKREFARNGVEPSRIHVNPLFPTHNFAGSGFPGLSEREGSRTIAEAPTNETDRRVQKDPAYTSSVEADWTVAFVGRMTVLKGGALLVDALAEASGRLGRAIRLLLIGDGPQRVAWERRASDRNVPCTATGWLTGDDRWTALRSASMLALPSTWPEPFGLVGLEAAALGIPAVAFDVGGVREWLRPGVNGYLVSAEAPCASTLANALVEAFTNREVLKMMGCRAVGVAREMSLDRHLDRLETIFDAHAHSSGR